ncbi:MAG: flagellar FliJ family protein [Granulosicoccus sp.]
MGSAQLSKLESLSEKRADKSRNSVGQSRTKLDQLEQHHNELQSISREYQATPESGVMFTSRLLAHRRAFVSQLVEKLDVLKAQREQQQQILNEQVQEFRERTAQSAAIGALHQVQQNSEQQAAARIEQRMQDESFRSVDISNKTNSEDSIDD